MKMICLLFACVPLLSQAPDPCFLVNFHGVAPSIKGHLIGNQSGVPIDVDLKDDLGLTKDGVNPGIDLEYQSSRFGLALLINEQKFSGFHRVNRTFTINGYQFFIGTNVTSSMKILDTDFNWTTRFMAPRPYWIGMDVGMGSRHVKLVATGSGVTAEQNLSIPVPQIGLSGGTRAFNDRLLVQGFYHRMSYRAMKYDQANVDVRFFPIKWLGVRAFFNSESLNVPKGSIKNDLEVIIDGHSAGLGLVLRFQAR